MNDCIFHRAGESNSSPAPLHAIYALQLVSSLLRRARPLGIVDHFRRRFACFKLGAHLLDLRCEKPTFAVVVDSGTMVCHLIDLDVVDLGLDSFAI
jgi:hypothetical protein